MTKQEKLVQAANRVADAWLYDGRKTNYEQNGTWHKIRDAALTELEAVSRAASSIKEKIALVIATAICIGVWWIGLKLLLIGAAR